MKNIDKKVNEVLGKQLKEFDILLKNMDEMYPREKQGYNLPPVDTIGKMYYNRMKRRVRNLL